MNSLLKIFKYIIGPLIGTLIISFILLLIINSLGDLSCFWDKFTISKAGETREFCEYHGMGISIRQPVNAWSNMSFIFFGLMYFVYALDDRKNSHEQKINFITKYWSFSIVLGIVMIFLGFGSFLFHSSLTQFSSRIDITGVVISCYIIFSYSFLRVYSLINYKKSKIFFLKTYKYYLVSILIFFIIFFITNFKGRELTVLLILSTIIINLYSAKKYFSDIRYKYFTISIILISISILAWLLDKFLICKPQSVFQLHAAWHVLTSFAVFFTYVFFRSEKLFKYQLTDEQ